MGEAGATEPLMSFYSPLAFTTQASFPHAHLYTPAAEVKGATCSLRAIHTDTRANEMPSGAMWASELLLKDTLTNGAGTETLASAVVTYKLLRQNFLSQ